MVVVGGVNFFFLCGRVDGSVLADKEVFRYNEVLVQKLSDLWNKVKID